MYEKAHARQTKSAKPHDLRPVRVEYAREMKVEKVAWDLIEAVAASELRDLAIVGVMKDGRIWVSMARAGDRFPIVAALEQLKFDLLKE